MPILINEVNVVAGSYYRIEFESISEDTATYSLYLDEYTLAQDREIEPGQVHMYFFRARSNVSYVDMSGQISYLIRFYELYRNVHLPWDGTGVAFSFNNQMNRWTKTMDLPTEHLAKLPNLMAAFKDGDLWLHDTGRANFFGVQYPWSVSVLTKDNMPVTKQPKWLSVEGSDKPDWTHIRTLKPNEQSSDLLASDYRDYEGRKYADIKRDRLTPGMDFKQDAPVLKGDVIIGDYVIIGAQFNNPDGYLNAINIQYNESKGHR